jgi:hypothetical protein
LLRGNEQIGLGVNASLSLARERGFRADVLGITTKLLQSLLRARDKWRHKARAAAISPDRVVPATLALVLEPDFGIPFP